MNILGYFTVFTIIITPLIHASEPFISINSYSRDVYFNAIKVTVTKGLFNDQVVFSGYAFQHQLEDAYKQGGCLFWIEVLVENMSVLDKIQVNFLDFNLLTSDRVSHKGEVCKRLIAGDINKGEIAQGGLLFIISTNTAPHSLRYEPNIVLKSLTFQNQKVVVSVPIPLKWTGGNFIIDHDYWQRTFDEMNPQLARLLKEQTKIATNTPLVLSDSKSKTVKKDDGALLKWQMQQASNGVAYSQYDLGKRYIKGDGVEVNRIIGMYWMKKSADQNYTDAIEYLRTNSTDRTH
jgi:hypothetical protein